MNNSRVFDAPWGLALKATTGIALGLMAGLLFGGLMDSSLPALTRLLLVALSVVVTTISMLFMIRGYEVANNAIRVQRLGWYSNIGLQGLKSIQLDPNVTLRSLRLCGNGGFFAFAGWYWNRALGRYRLWATDPKRIVVLRFEDHCILVSPGQPEAFVSCVKEQTGLK